MNEARGPDSLKAGLQTLLPPLRVLGVYQEASDRNNFRSAVSM